MCGLTKCHTTADFERLRLRRLTYFMRGETCLGGLILRDSRVPGRSLEFLCAEGSPFTVFLGYSKENA